MSSVKEKVAINSIVASALMSIAKFTVGFMTGSLGLISEGLHSLLDLGATIMTYFAVRVSDKPADDTHHYGHGKIESVTALAETILLFLTSIWIVYEAGHRLIAGGSHVEFTWWAVIVIVGSMAIDYHRARALKKVAIETKSQALEADALHFSSDILTSAVVLLGLLFVYLGWENGDSIAAIAVALFICKVGWDMAKRTIDTLIDAAPEGITEHIHRLLLPLPAVLSVDRVRARPAGSILYLDLDINVNRALSPIQVQKVKDDIMRVITEDMPETEISISFHPIVLDTETTHQKVLLMATNMHIPIHHLMVHFVGDVISVTMDVEIDGTKTMKEAHDLVTHFEQAIKDELGGNVEIDTHIEPLVVDYVEGEDVSDDVQQKIMMRMQDIVAGHPSLRHIHDVRVRQTTGGLVIVYHCLVDENASVYAAHRSMDVFEQAVRADIPEILRIIGHAETVMH